MKVALIAPQRRVEDAYRRSSEDLFRKAGANTGNFAFVQALWAHLSPHVEIFPWEASPDVLRERCDIIVMACANQLGPHSNLERLAIMFERTKLPILAIGLGAQANEVGAAIELSPGTRRWLEVVADCAPSKAPNIGVRGAFSLEQVERGGAGGRAVVTGCPSNFINPEPSLATTLEARYRRDLIERVAVPAGLHHWAKLRALERALADIVESTSGLYVAQSEIDMIRMARGEWEAMDPATFESLRSYVRPALSDDAFRLWCKRHATCFADATSWMDAMRNFDFVVGPRFHGVMLAMQAGTPGGVIAHDSRTLEMCQTMEIPVRMHDDMPAEFRASDLPALFPFEAAAYAARRAELAERHADMLIAAGVKPSPDLLGLRAKAVEPASTDAQKCVAELAPAA
ncbi:MAG TPA: polysaccharide pyruvyl transferase family protein [Roseiarcus sp.]|nr:polysaccharide pyruvyl transferase family protein [Roseiarcus sp.]